MSNEVRDLWSTLKTQRDELRLQMHLARAELRKEWDDVEKKWRDAEQKFDTVLDDAGETAREAQGVLKVVGEEISAAYDRIKARLDDEK